MAKLLRFHRYATEDALEAADWYERQAEGLGDRFKAAVESQLARIAAAPQYFPQAFTERDYFFARIPKFPYNILFQIDEDSVFIMAIMHSASDPIKWNRRRE